MIELYVGITLLGLGWVMNQNRPPPTKTQMSLTPSDIPSARNIYDTGFIKTANHIQKKIFSQPGSEVPMGEKALEARTKRQKSQLTDSDVEFVHNNMHPFVRKGVTQTTAMENSFGARLESFTGSDPFYKPKQESDTMFQPVKDITNVCGAPVQTDILKTRYVEPMSQRNVLPFQQVKVGKGLGQGFTATPMGGLHQMETQDFAKPKTVDDLRVKTNPKLTYAGRVVDGQKGQRAGKIGAVSKNRVDTFFKNSPDRYFTTTGAVIKDKQRPLLEAKETSRQTTVRDYSGIPYQNVGEAKRGEARESHRNQLGGFDMPKNANLAHLRNQTKDDYGKGSIQVYSNERDITTVRTRIGNLATMVKALTAPISDLVKTSKKEYTTEHPRSFGQFQTTMPGKATVYDPNDVARTTLKETILNPGETMNFNGPKRITVYDPNAVARTTLKETTLHDADAINLNAPSRITVYDPNDVARTTLKETMLHNSELANIKGDRSMGIVYDPNLKAKRTVRETLEQVDDGTNMASVRKASTVYDPNDVAKTTLKETIVGHVREYGNVNNSENFVGGYENESYDVPTTQKDVLADYEYAGNPAAAEGDGYKISSAEAKNTQRQLLSDNDYYGTAADQTSHAQMSYADVYNATLNELREDVLQKREPTQSGLKSMPSMEGVGPLQTRRLEMDEPSPEFQNMDRLASANNAVDIKSLGTLTRRPNSYEDEDRLDPDLLRAFNENPYTKSLGSIA